MIGRTQTRDVGTFVLKVGPTTGYFKAGHHFLCGGRVFVVQREVWRSPSYQQIEAVEL